LGGDGVSDAVTIRERIHVALLHAGPLGLSMAAIAATVTGPWRARDVEAVVRKLWQGSELGRRSDGTFVLTGKATGHGEALRPTQTREGSRLDAAVRRVAKDARREGHDTRIKVRTVDPALLSAYCPKCRASVHPKLDGCCASCGTQCGANQEAPPKPRRRRRSKPLRKGQPGYGTTCRCGAPKTVQSHRCRACGFKRRSGRQLGPRPTHKPPKNITDELLLEARRLYATGLSIRQIAEQIHPQTTYASVNACKTSLYSLFKRRGWKLRPQREVTRARSTKHGRKARSQTREQQNAYRRWLAAQRGWKAIQGPGRPICKGVRMQPPGKGKPCNHHALMDSEYCWSHDPRFELDRQAQAAKMRARKPTVPMLPAEPFSAWLGVLYSELGTWKAVAAVIGADCSAAHRWADGVQNQNGKPLERISVRVVKRSAENAGTTIEAIYVDVDQVVAA
jgi:hypothetical protein